MPNSVTPSMPLNTAVPSERRISAPAPTAMTSGTTPKMKANDVIRIGRSRSRDASSVASTERLPFLVQLLGELDDQDGVLARQADQHHQADLHEDVDVAVREQHAGDGTEQAQRHDQDDRQRQRPAFVQRRQGQEDADHGQGEDVHRRVARPDLHEHQLRPLRLHGERQVSCGPARSTVLMASPVLTPACMLPLMAAAV